MRTWLGKHAAIVAEPIIQLEDHEDFLWEQLAKKPLIGRAAMRTALREARGVDVKEAPIRAWLAAHQGALPIPFAEAALSSSGPSMALLQLSDMDQYADLLHRQLSEAADITAAALRDKLIQEHAVSWLERTVRSWLDRARAAAPKRAIKRGSGDLPTLENLSTATISGACLRKNHL